jgi:antitoxin component YwqK of YwqJK toxin-antitoxin module
MIKAGASILCFMVLFYAVGQQVEQITYYDKSDSLVKEKITVDGLTRQLSGPYLKYHQNGRVAVAGFYKNNLPDSNWIFHYESGRTKTQGRYKDGKPNGLWKSYYENGNLRNEGNFENSTVAGSWNYYYENGNLKLEAYYEGGLEAGKWKYFFEGGPIKESTLYHDSPNGMHTSYYYTGEVAAEGQKTGKTSTGSWTYFYRDGNIKSTGSFHNGLKQDTWTSYYPSGALKSEGLYSEGKKTGEWVYYHENGEIQTIGLMSKDQQTGTWTTYTDKGDIQGIAKLENGTGSYTSYHLNGQLASMGYMTEGLMDSTWAYFNKAGDKIGSAVYDSNEGMYTGLYPNGAKRISGKLIGNKKVGEWTIYNIDGEKTGTYHPFYDQKKIETSSAQTSEPIEPDPVAFDATKSDYGYQNRINRYFDEVINEFDAWIIAGNPMLFLLDRFPVAIEYYQQERLGYEFIYEHQRSPFTFDDNVIGIEELYSSGHSFSIRQKFYSKAFRAGMYYFGHQVRGTTADFKLKTQETSGFRNILTSTAAENTLTYGWMIGWKFMRDAGESGLTIDAYTGINMGLKTWEIKEAKDSRAEEIFSEVSAEPLIFPISFGLNIGWAFKQPSKKRKRR